MSEKKKANIFYYGAVTIVCYYGLAQVDEITLNYMFESQDTNTVTLQIFLCS